ncbi:hypothetical protein Bca52824_003411 [Brassica carinata]|uniref:Replication factor A C-terminal domain-containing protein n=1 Tax=Brassica carinata TaxID=52824 RepID=A0A8X7WM25_BRACI|nr:hypothetical protein Bca52824_003411 [Brassica carinata]
MTRKPEEQLKEIGSKLDPPPSSKDSLLKLYADNGWCYVACSKCSRKLQRTVSTFTCARCANSHAVGALRYRDEMAISDDTAEGTFVWFDGVMTKLHNLRASDVAQMLGDDDDGVTTSQFLLWCETSQFS